MSNDFSAEQEAIQNLIEGLEVNKIYSQPQVAAMLGITDKTLRGWIQHLVWIYYWKVDQLIQGSQFTSEGIRAMLYLQHFTRPMVPVINPKTKKFVVDRKSGKSRTKKQTPRTNLFQYAEEIWARSHVPPNPKPFSSTPSTPEVTELLKEKASATAQEQEELEVIDGEIENESTILVFGSADNNERLEEMVGNIVALAEDGQQSMSNLFKHVVGNAASQGKMLGTMAATAMVQEHQKAVQAGIQQAFGVATAAAPEPLSKEMKRQTKKV